MTVYIHVYACICTCVFTCVCIYMYICVYNFTCVYIYMNMCVYMCIYYTNTSYKEIDVCLCRYRRQCYRKAGGASTALSVKVVESHMMRDVSFSVTNVISVITFIVLIHHLKLFLKALGSASGVSCVLLVELPALVFVVSGNVTTHNVVRVPAFLYVQSVTMDITKMSSFYNVLIVSGQYQLLLFISVRSLSDQYQLLLLFFSTRCEWPIPASTDIYFSALSMI